jgi:hypothetical protein
MDRIDLAAWPLTFGIYAIFRLRRILSMRKDSLWNEAGGPIRRPKRSLSMPKLPDDMSAAAVKKRAEISAATKAKPKTEEVVAPKPRMAKKR